jgi:hypothetical protein
MKRSLRTRKTANLPQSVQRQLHMYALAAGAAGLGLVTPSQLAEAKIVYTPANIPIVLNGEPVGLDLNQDGINDFQFSNRYHLFHNASSWRNFYSSVMVVPLLQSNGVLQVESRVTCAAALRRDRKVGPRGTFFQERQRLPLAAGYGNNIGRSSFCPWAGIDRRYLGVKFTIGGKVHFGWARIKMRALGKYDDTIVGYAYETIPNKPIITGKTSDRADNGDGEDFNSSPSMTNLTLDGLPPTSLGLLALGAGDIPHWRVGPH